jgi:SAM-dependent methyltransferase
MSTPFEANTCSAPAERSARMRDIVLERAPRGGPLQILDVGCGTGALAFRLAESLPEAIVTGVDISPANIRAAEARRRAAPGGDRVRFVRADYLEHETAPVDIIVTDTVLHFIHARPLDLWTKLARDVRPGGLLVCAMAYDCLHNRALDAARRALRAVRGRPVDWLLMALGRIAYGQSMDDALIRERIEYMYIPPEQLMSSAIESMTRSVGLDLVARHAMPGVSATQLEQRVSVFQKDVRDRS